MNSLRRNKVYIVGTDYAIARMYQSKHFLVVNSIRAADIVQFTGGSDVSPELYGEKTHPLTLNNPVRDKKEKEVFEWCVENDKAMVGICRGGQFLNVMNGGKMWQHIDNHAIGSTHEAYNPITGLRFQVTSTHHQMMRPDLEKGEVILGANLTTMVQTATETLKLNGPDIEAVWYKDTKCFCYQPHPEYMAGKGACRDFFFDQIAERIQNVEKPV